MDEGGGDGDVLSDAIPGDFFSPGARLAQADEGGRYRIDIAEEEARGGHTIRDHVRIPDIQLLGVLESEVYRGPLYSFYKEAQGSFLSRESANDFVNRVLERNARLVDAVASGLQEEAWLEERFGFPTGKQAFRPGPELQLYIRPTYKVGVLIRYDQRSKRGYSVHTAYPLNESNTGGGYNLNR